MHIYVYLCDQLKPYCVLEFKSRKGQGVSKGGLIFNVLLPKNTYLRVVGKVHTVKYINC